MIMVVRYNRGPKKKAAKRPSVDASEAARALNAMRRTHGAGTGRPRTIEHDPSAKRCTCVDCRKARSNAPPLKRSPAIIGNNQLTETLASGSICSKKGCKYSLETKDFCSYHAKQKREQDKQWRAKRKEAGLCFNCTNPIARPTAIFCVECIERRRQAAQLRDRDRLSEYHRKKLEDHRKKLEELERLALNQAPLR
jgi:hypothetical protein